MNECYCFIGDGVNDVWPLPFVPGAPPVVSLARAGGLEKRLLAGRDFSLSGNNLIVSLEQGDRLYVRAAQGEGSRAIPARAMSQPGLNGAGLTPQNAVLDSRGAQVTEEEAGEALERRYMELSSRLRSGSEEFVEKARQDLAQALKAALEKALASIREEGRRAGDDKRLANAPLPQRSRLEPVNGCRAGSWLTVPAYLPGTNTLRVHLDGLLLAPGLDYEEVGADNESSVTIRILKEVPAGSFLDCCVESIGNSEQARLSARDAQKAQQSAASLLAAARTMQDNAASLSQTSANELNAAQGWAGAAQKSAELAYQAAVKAYDAAAQISLYRREPGICAVKDKADIHACSPGLFIINPHLSHAPTPFFGVWPASCIQEMSWDGVFFLGGKCYPPDPELPPSRPPRPQPDPLPLAGGADEWIPCGHSHVSPPPCDPASCSAWPPRAPCACQNAEDKGTEEE